MQKNHTIQDIRGVTDSSKGQKLVAALYLVTNHLSDNDPLKVAIRSHAVVFADPRGDVLQVVPIVTNLLNAAVLIGLVSEQNVNIIIRELMKYTGSAHSSIDTFFTEPSTSLSYTAKPKTFPRMSIMSDTLSNKSENNHISNDNKNKRQNDILSFINDRKSAAIKDISTLFPDVSEKTIQRELTTLVADGRITKRGSKRWSIYMAI